MQKLKLGIIGIGHLGTFHLKVCKNIEEIELIGIFDLDPQRTKRAAQEFGVNPFFSLEELLSQVQAVSIVVPTSEHFTVARTCLEHGCHLFLEKPITATVEQAETLIALAKKYGLKLQVGHIERFNPAFLALDSMELNPMFIETHRLSQFNPRGTDVSVILDLMIHDLDIILNLVKAPLTQIDACGVSVVSPGEDIANVRLSFANGCVANLTASRISVKKMRKMRIFQPNQYLALDFLKQEVEIFKLSKQKEQNGLKITQIGIGEQKKDIFYLKPPVPAINPLQEELKSFAQSILLDQPVRVSGEEGLRNLKIATEIINQLKSPQTYV